MTSTPSSGISRTGLVLQELVSYACLDYQVEALGGHAATAASAFMTAFGKLAEMVDEAAAGSSQTIMSLITAAEQATMAELTRSAQMKQHRGEVARGIGVAVNALGPQIFGDQWIPRPQPGYKARTKRSTEETP